MLFEGCCIGSSSAFLWGVGSILNGFSDQKSQSSSALVEKDVLPFHDAVFANCIHRYQVSGN